MPRLYPLGDEITGTAAIAGAKAARLARAAGAGLAVLPGWVVPVAVARPALRAGAGAVRAGRPAAARRAVLGCRLDDGLATELRDAVIRLGGRVIVRSSSPLESDPRWSGAFSSVAEVGADDVVSAVRSCWASAFAVDPLERLAACGLPPEALELGVLLQPEIRPAAGGVARVTGTEVIVEGVLGHPGALLAGWAEGATAHVRGTDADGQLTDLLGSEQVASVAALAGRVWRTLGDDVIEWAAGAGGIWLLQSLRSAPVTAAREPLAREPLARGPLAQGPAAPGHNAGEVAAGGHELLSPPGTVADLLASRTWMPLLAATVLDRGEHVPGRPAAPGTAAGRLVACRAHERPPGDTADAILLVDRPLPALAPLLFSARGVIARTGAAGSHLAEVARSLGVPMVIGCRPETVTGPAPGAAGGWLAAVDGSSGDVALLPGPDGGMT
jgi:phosphohistidine swiveling domain-containing protein